MNTPLAIQQAATSQDEIAALASAVTELQEKLCEEKRYPRINALQQDQHATAGICPSPHSRPRFWRGVGCSMGAAITSIPGRAHSSIMGISTARIGRQLRLPRTSTALSMQRTGKTPRRPPRSMGFASPGPKISRAGISPAEAR